MSTFAPDTALEADRISLDIAGESLSDVPNETPLAMTAQRFDRNFVDNEVPVWDRQPVTTLWRILAFLPAFLMTVGFVYTFYDFFKAEGVNGLEFSIMFLTAFAFIWIAMSVGFAFTGALVVSLRKFFKPASLAPPKPLNVALLALTFNEQPAPVFANGIAALQDLMRSETSHRYSIYFLSDSNDPDIREQELEVLKITRQKLPSGTSIFYRNRPNNIGRKAGNIADWCRRWGASHEAFLILDADSLMNADCINMLADELGRDPAVALAQSLPRLLEAKSIFARAQQFASATYGGTLAAGIARVYGNQSSYWGHNAMIRTRAFARSAGLPDLPGRAPLGGMIMSHDFVEAALLCRAGWKVKLLPGQTGSYEGTPQTLVDYCLRDRRWCQGNLQHLRVLGAKRLRPISRFQLFQGAMIYVAPFAWFLLLIIWGGLGYYELGREITYFSEANPLMPLWPGMASMQATTYLGIVYGMLLVPKLVGAGVTLSTNRLFDLGGGLRFAISIVLEILISVVLAPILMVQQSMAVVKTTLGFDAGWKPQNRNGDLASPLQLMRFHATETIIGLALTAGIFFGAISFWLLPIAASLLLAVPISFACSVQIGRNGWFCSLLGSYEDFNEPDVAEQSHRNREYIESQMA